jgi:hypothetical protein
MPMPWTAASRRFIILEIVKRHFIGTMVFVLLIEKTFSLEEGEVEWQIRKLE